MVTLHFRSEIGCRSGLVEGDRTLAVIAATAARRFAAPFAFVSLHGAGGSRLEAAHGAPVDAIAPADAGWARWTDGDEVAAVLDAVAEAAPEAPVPLLDGVAVAFVAAAPLVGGDGRRFGALVVADRSPRPAFGAAEAEALADLAAIAAGHLEAMRPAAPCGVGARRVSVGSTRDLDCEIAVLFENAPFAMAMLDRDLRHVVVSRPWCEALGVGAAALIGRDVHDGAAGLPEDWRAGHEAVLAGARFEAVDVELPGADGTRRWVRRHVRPWWDRTGAVGGLLLFHEPLDDLKAKERALARNVAFLEAVLENVRDGVVACDEDGAITYANGAARGLYGIDVDRVPPAAWAMRYDLFECDGLTPLALADNPLHRAMNGETVDAHEGTIAPKGGSPRRVVASTRPMRDPSGRVVGAVATIHDLTGERASDARRREAEQRYRALFDHSVRFSARLDPDGRVVEVNDRALAFAGAARDDVVDRPFRDGPWWCRDEASRRRLRDAIATARQGRFVRYEATVRGVDGQRLPLDFSLKPIVDDDGRVTGLIAEGRDVSGERETEALLELVSDSLPFLVSYVDRHLRYRFMNRTGAAWFGRTVEAIVGAPVAEILGAATFAALRPQFERASRGEEAAFEGQVACPDGTARAIEATCVPDRADDGEPRGFVVIVRDVTDRHRADAEIRRKTRELELMFDHVPVLIFHKDDRNRILRLNRAAARSMGTTVAAAEGGDTYALFPELAAKYHADDLAVIESGVPKLGIVEEYAPEGRPKTWVRTDKVPAVDPATGERFVFVVATDITAEKLAEDALRTSEERYRRLYNETPIMQQAVDADGRLIQVSDYWLEKLGWERDEVIGRPAVDFLSPPSRVRAAGDVVWKLRSRGVSKDVEYQMARKDGGVVDVLLSAVAERDADGRIVRSLEVMTDITDRKIIERQFAQAQKMETVGKLTGGLAHDFNNLLGVVLGNLQLVQRSIAADERASRRIAAALKAVDKGADLTRRLLAFSRLQKLETESVDPDPLILEVGAILRRTLGETIDLVFDLAGDLPPIETDPSQLQSALFNLAVNARDAMPNGGRLTIRSRLHVAGVDPWDGGEGLEPGVRVAISVADTGQGIPVDHLDRVFEPFFTTKGVGRGSGLGLSMVYGFMKQSGGHVAIASTVGEGTVVTMLSPLAVAPPRLQAEPVATGPRRGSGEIVLVVEDQTDVREVTIALIEDLGYRSLAAADAHEALAIVDAGAPIDLVFTDIVMPGGILGTELARLLAERRPAVPCLFATGYAEARLLAEGAASGGTNLLFKPYSRSDLAEMFRAALEAARPGRSPSVEETVP